MKMFLIHTIFTIEKIQITGLCDNSCGEMGCQMGCQTECGLLVQWGQKKATNADYVTWEMYKYLCKYSSYCRLSFKTNFIPQHYISSAHR